MRRLSHLHPYAACSQGGHAIASTPKSGDPLFMHGSVEDAISAVAEAEESAGTGVRAEDFYFFAGACFWEPGQLQRQVWCARGCALCGCVS